jgi:hypothetical protein
MPTDMLCRRRRSRPIAHNLLNDVSMPQLLPHAQPSTVVVLLGSDGATDIGRDTVRIGGFIRCGLGRQLRPVRCRRFCCGCASCGARELDLHIVDGTVGGHEDAARRWQVQFGEARNDGVIPVVR